jgi:hypothetical protein
MTQEGVMTASMTLDKMDENALRVRAERAFERTKR